MAINFDVGQKEKIEKMFEKAEAPVKVQINFTQLESLFTKAAVSISLLVKKAEDFNITSVETRATAIEMGTQAKQIYNMIEKKRTEMKRPYLDFSQKLDGLCKPLKDSLDIIQNGIKKKIKLHIDAENKRQAEAERKRLEVEAALNPEASPPPAAPVGSSRSVIEKKQVTSSGSAAVKKVWKWKQTTDNIAEIPVRYLMLNESAIKVAIEMGVRDIPGIEIYEDSDIKLTVSRGGFK